MLIDVLQDKLNLFCRIDKHTSEPIIYINKESLNILTDMVKPYFSPSMLYKLRL